MQMTIVGEQAVACILLCFPSGGRLRCMMGFGPVLRSCELLSIWRQLKSIVRMGGMRLWGRVGAYACVAGGGPDQPFLLRELRWKLIDNREQPARLIPCLRPVSVLPLVDSFKHWNAGLLIAERSFFGCATTFMGWSYPNQLGFLRSLQRRIN